MVLKSRNCDITIYMVYIGKKSVSLSLAILFFVFLSLLFFLCVLCVCARSIILYAKRATLMPQNASKLTFCKTYVKRKYVSF